MTGELPVVTAQSKEGHLTRAAFRAPPIFLEQIQQPPDHTRIVMTVAQKSSGHAERARFGKSACRFRQAGAK